MTTKSNAKTNHRWRKVSGGLLLALMLGGAPLHAQDTFALNRKVHLQVKKKPLSEVLASLEKQANVHFVFDGSQLNSAMTVSLVANNKPLEEVLNSLLPADAQYKVIGNQVVVKRTGQTPTPTPAPQERPVTTPAQKDIEVAGTVVLRSEKGDIQTVPGVNVRIKGSNVGTVTNNAGQFEITAPENAILVFSFVGYKPREVSLGGRSSLKITLEEDVSSIKEVVVTGVFERAKESFTGSASTFTGRQLKAVGNQNVIQSLRSLDPAFSVFENNRLGSNPNALPDLEIQGRTSILGLKEQLGADPNLPLFILDGFQTSLRFVMDLDINRVESVTILKDAASTAIYGSRAANGVIVIETRKPKAGELRVTYTTDNTLSIPDLRDYNLMNASEKLEFERLSGRYTPTYQHRHNYTLQADLDSQYNAKLAEVQRGVNTYWMNEPLRTVIGTGHSLYVEGGDPKMLYGVGLTYRKTPGVMKGSGRDVGSGNIKLQYRQQKLSFSNNLTLNFFKSNESPYGVFSSYSRANPYYRKTNDDGTYARLLETTRDNTGRPNYNVPNPLWDAALPNKDETNNFDLINNFQLEYAIRYDLRFRARFGITKKMERTERFSPSLHSKFLNVPLMEKGSYTSVRNDANGYDGDLTFTYGRVFNEKHMLNLLGGWSIRQNRFMSDSYGAVGFPDHINSPAYAATYTPAGKPTSTEATSRATSFYGQGNYTYDRRFVTDFSYRLDGSSNYGANNLFTRTWSVGLAWNVHEEAFLDKRVFNTLRLRGSVGNPGNENGLAYQSFTTFNYNTVLQNYFGIGANIDAFGNPDLQWQQTLKRTVGIDAILFERLRFNADYVMQETDPLVAVINLPASVGTALYTTNIGQQSSKGYNFLISYSPIFRPKEQITWSFNFSGKHERARYEEIGNKLDVMNKLNQSRNLDRYYDYGSPTALWAVRSHGIDPSTGRELFIKKDGSLTYDYDYDDEVVVGDSRADLDGIVGTQFSYKNFSCNVYLRYRIGGSQFNTALFEKVENINLNGLKQNQDRRALYDRWKRPGDISQFKGISLTDESKISSRFVQEENTFAGESINVSYEFNKGKVQHWGISYIRLSAYMNDIFRISSLRRERGIDYPFANSLGFSASVAF